MYNHKSPVLTLYHLIRYQLILIQYQVPAKYLLVSLIIPLWKYEFLQKKHRCFKLTTTLTYALVQGICLYSVHLFIVQLEEPNIHTHHVSLCPRKLALFYGGFYYEVQFVLFSVLYDANCFSSKVYLFKIGLAVFLRYKSAHANTSLTAEPRVRRFDPR